MPLDEAHIRADVERHLGEFKKASDAKGRARADVETLIARLDVRSEAAIELREQAAAAFELSAEEDVDRWMAVMSVGQERMFARLAALEKSSDQARTPLERLATTEEERTGILKVRTETQAKWGERVFNAPWFGFLMLGLAVAVLQALGSVYQTSQLVQLLAGDDKIRNEGSAP